MNMAKYTNVKSVSYKKDSIAKENKWGKNCLDICAIYRGQGGFRRLMANAILHLHFLESLPRKISDRGESVSRCFVRKTFCLT